MESNCCKTNILANDVWNSNRKQLENEKKCSNNQSVDEMQVPCMKSSKSGSKVRKQSINHR